jgi:hypothetical protein
VRRASGTGVTADAQFAGQLVQSQALAGAVGALKDPATHVSCDVLRKLRSHSEFGGTDQIRYSLSRLLLMMVFWISLVPSPISRNGASRISRSISYSLEYP